MVELSYTWVSQLDPFCIWYPCCDSSLKFGSPFQSYHLLKQELHSPLKFYDGLSLRTPLYMSICNYIIMSFACLIEPYASFPNFDYQPYSLILSHVQPRRAFLYIFCNLIPDFFLQGGDIPRLLFSYTCFLALSIGMFYYLELVCFPLHTRILLDL